MSGSVHLLHLQGVAGDPPPGGEAPRQVKRGGGAGGGIEEEDVPRPEVLELALVELHPSVPDRAGDGDVLEGRGDPARPGEAAQGGLGQQQEGAPLRSRGGDGELDADGALGRATAQREAWGERGLDLGLGREGVERPQDRRARARRARPR